MEGIGVIIGIAVVLPVLWAIASAMSVAGVKKKFADMGVLTGKTKGEIYFAVGPPNSISVIGEGKEILQWQRTGYHIALIFTNGICDGISHEYSA
ncbi:hypothetical protein [Janthinobacterium sp. J1-1]|uniref:hypothetical protein n=1 Tax=Janthinobacterium sp. J1-1 TaxID=3065910 RepID=UPI002811E3DA|nr:hypothetical protein [Janthinobacterium sp. J1-1]